MEQTIELMDGPTKLVEYVSPVYLQSLDIRNA